MGSELRYLIMTRTRNPLTQRAQCCQGCLRLAVVGLEVYTLSTHTPDLENWLDLADRGTAERVCYCTVNKAVEYFYSILNIRIQIVTVRDWRGH